MSFGWGMWPPAPAGGGGGSPMWLAFIPAAGGAPPIATPDFIASVINTGPGVYDIELGPLGDQILGTPLGQPQPIVACADNGQAWHAQTTQAPPDPWIFTVTFAGATNADFIFSLAFPNPLVLFP